jgi:hypothetical protein
LTNDAGSVIETFFASPKFRIEIGAPPAPCAGNLGWARGVSPATIPLAV